MVFSNLFQDKFIDQVQVVGYLHQWEARGNTSITSDIASHDIGGDFVYFQNNTSFRIVSPNPLSGSFIDGSKMLHAAKVYSPHVKAPHIDKNKDTVLRYVGGEEGL